jgi:3-oxoadipate enol-lactonase
MKIDASGICINCEISGREGAPWVAFSNSLMTDLTMWDDQAVALGDSFRVLRYDQRGHGGTDAPAGPYPFNTLVSDVVALFDALGIANAHFVGLSMGGMTAVALAERHPGRVNRLVAADCGPASTPQSAQQWAERIALANEGGMEALVEPTVGRWFPPEFAAANKAVVDKVRNMVRTTPLNGFIGCASALSDFDLKPGLAQINNSIQFLCGSKDASLGGTKALNAGIPGSTLIEIPGAGHISNMENPGMFTRAVREFLTGS